jgi:hypothetical protein
MIDALVRGSRVVLRAGALVPWLVLTAVVCAGVVLVDLVSAFFASAALVLLGPLLPIAGLGLSYVPSMNVDYQLVVASPYSTLRLLLLRAAVFLALAAPVLLFCGHRLEGVQFGARVLAHAAAVVAVALAQSTLMAPTLSAAVVSFAWMSLVHVVLMAGGLVDITSSPAVALAVCTAAAALFVLVVRRRALSTDWRYS